MTKRKKYGHIWILLAYIPIYLIWFFVLENRDNPSLYLIQSGFDHHIPFNEWFIIPYLIWFPYLIGGIFFFYFRGIRGGEERKQYYQMAFFLVAGMTIALVVYTFWPNGLNLRPAVYPRQNIATTLVASLQGFDTPSNVCPSLHVYTTLVMNTVIWRSKFFCSNVIVKIISLFITLCICASTVFLKQHSVIDVFWAVVMYAALYLLTYRILWRKSES